MKRGFTLVELLGVIVILSLLMVIVFPTVINLINNTNQKIDQATLDLIYTASDNYITIHQSDFPKRLGNKFEIAIDVLEAENLLPQDLKNISGKCVEVTYRDKYTYEVVNCYPTLKSLIEKETSHISKNTVINGKIVNKVYGTKDEQTTMKNYIIYSGQLWEVVETNDTNHSIKLASPVSLTSIAYGTNNTWSTSWVRKWLNEVFYPILERKDLIVDTEFCLDNIDVTPSSYTQKLSCTNKINEKVGLLTYEDYIYAKDGITIQNGGSFLDEDELSWLITPTSTNTTYIWHTYYNNPSLLTINDTTFKVNTNGQGVRPVISIKDSVLVKGGEGTRSNPYILSTERNLNTNDKLNLAKVGDYIYLDESNGPSNSFTEYTATKVYRTTTKDKVRYRIVSINNDGSIKIERADILRNLPSTVYSGGPVYMYFYSNDSGSGETSCLYSTAHKYGDTGRSSDYYLGGCTNHSIFNPNEGSGDFTKDTGENIGYYLNNATNSFYNWYSDKTKSMIIPTTFNLYTSGYAKDYSNLNNGTVTTYPNRTNDGSVTVNVGLPTWGDLYTGNDLNVHYWYINRWPSSPSIVSIVDSGGFASGSSSPGAWYAARPVLTLSPNVYVTGGDGTANNPYALDI